LSTDDADELETFVCTYLKEALDLDAGRDLARVFNHYGLTNEGNALASLCEQGDGSVFILEKAPWQGHSCTVSFSPPESASSGDLWFDPVELIPMVFIQEQSVPELHFSAWLSIHPVTIWQMRVFLRLVQWQQVRKYFMDVTDLMDKGRYGERNGLAFATDAYHEEAVAYAHWFGKHLSDQFVLAAAKKTLGADQYEALFPEQMRLWDEAEFSLSEFHRMAFGADTVETDPYDEWEIVQDGASSSLLDRMVIPEWERSRDLGLLTMLRCDVGFIEQEQRMAYEFVGLKNSAPRQIPTTKNGIR